MFFLASIFYIGNRTGAGFFSPCNGPNNSGKKQANSKKDQETDKSYLYGKGLADTGKGRRAPYQGSIPYELPRGLVVGQRHLRERGNP
ncbi:MAG: hypothetical protein DRQ02_08130 [Candidatus Latescibacterota bacterium]|nr:MAG: hypothetical protein DRQ02_08130 [Candidatus Latescibacterota bacterium]